MKPTEDEKAGMLLLAWAVLIAVWGTFHYMGPTASIFYACINGITVLVSFIIGVLFLMHRGWARLGLLISHIKCEVWQPIGPFKRRRR